MLRLLVKTGVVRSIGIGSAFLVNVFLVRLLEPHEMGVFLIVMSLALFLSIIVRCGMKQTALKYVAGVKTDFGVEYVRDVVNKVLKVVLLGNAILYALYFLLAGLFSELFAFDLQVGIYVMIWSTGLSFLIPISNVYRGMGWIVSGALLDNVFNNVLMCTVFALCLLIGYTCDLVFALSVGIAATFFCLFVSLVGLYAKFPLDGKRANLPYSRLLSVSSWVLITNLSTYLLANAGLWIIGYVADAGQAAYYGIALKIYNLLAFPLLVINISIEPDLVSLTKQSKRQETIHLMRKTASLGFSISLCCYIGLVFFGRDFIDHFFGENYGPAYAYLMILATANLVHVWTGSSINFLVLNGSQKLVSNVTAIAAIVSLTIGFLATSEYGAVGMACVSAIVVVLQQLFIWRFLLVRGYKSHPYLRASELLPLIGRH